MTEIIIQNYGAIGRITLNRPKALNALTHDMVRAITEALKSWEEDTSISSVVIEGTGDKAFCAGGDIQTIYDNGRTNPDMIRQFWYEEYQLNYFISQYPKPYIAFMDGFVMGGGVGVSAHGSHRFVTERSLVAMPEVSIGFLPDVGGSWLCSQSPGNVGLYCGLTAARMNAADAIYTGFADYYIPSEDIEDLVENLRDGQSIDELSQKFSPAFETPCFLEQQHDEIDNLFGAETLAECLDAIEHTDSDFAKGVNLALKQNSPFAVTCAFYAIRQASALGNLKACLEQEYRYAYRCLEGDDFFEGIRAAVIDKDRNPQWNPANYKEVDEHSVKEMFAPLGEKSLVI